MTAPRTEVVDTVATRLTLHRLAEDVLAPEQQAANGEIALEVTPHGFGTGHFRDGSGELLRVRVEGRELVRERGDDETDRGAIEGPFDDAAAEILYAWWALGEQVLASLDVAPGETVSPVTLWPEHFDIAVTVSMGDSSVNLGFSPGDDFCPQPYVYAGPWQPQDGGFWNAPFGAFRSRADIASAERAAAFLDEALALLRGGH